VIAVPNGSGKSTLSCVLRSRVALLVIDSDAIARTLRPDAREGAAIAGARQALRRQQAHIALRTGFM
jgi:predicted ABC-type ATPase